MVSVNKETCIGCGACTAICAEVFEMVGDKASVKAGQEERNDDCVNNAKDSCPVNAIN